MVTHRVSRQSRDMSSMNAEMSGRVCSARQHAIRVRRHRRKQRQQMNDWSARDVTASIDINASWPNEMFTLNQLTVCFVSFVSSTSLFLSVVSAEEHASTSDAMAIE